MLKSKSPEELGIGNAIRKIRKNVPLTLIQLAQKTDFSPGYISKIETGKASPSLGTLQKLLTALRTTITEVTILSGLKKEFIVFIPKTNLPTNLMMIPSIQTPRFYVAEKQLKEEKEQEKQKLFLSFLRLDPQQKSGQLRPHVGEECACVIKGRVSFHFKVNEQFPEYVLEPGDVIHFKSSTPHYAKNTGKETAYLLIVR